MQRALTKALFLFALAFNVNAQAADQIEVEVDTAIEPTEAIGLILSQNGSEQRLDTTWKRATPGVVTVSIPITRSDRTEGTVVTAMVIGQDGEVAFGNTKPAWIKGITSSAYSLPHCATRKAPKGLDTAMASLQSLVDVRKGRRSALKLKISNLLSGDFLKTVSNLEQGFGMEYGHPLDGNLPALELIDRVNRLEQAILNYRAKKEALAEAADAAEATEAAEPAAAAAVTTEDAAVPSTEEAQ